MPRGGGVQMPVAVRIQFSPRYFLVPTIRMRRACVTRGNIMQPCFKFRHGFIPSVSFIVALTAASPGYAQQQKPLVIADEVVVTATRFKDRYVDTPVNVT